MFKYTELKPSTNLDKGIDLHLRLLGIEDRADWEILSVSNLVIGSELARCEPDWVLCYRGGERYRVVEYKNRDLMDGDATDYEKYQVTIYAMVLEEHMYRTTGVRPRVEAALFYADSATLFVERDEEDERRILEAGLTAPTSLYLLGVHDSQNRPVTATQLARYLVDPGFTDPRFDRTEAQRTGTRAHLNLQNSGPRILH